MKTINVYDFDGTIYNGDSSVDFYFYCLRKKPLILKYLPKQALAFFKYYVLKKGNITITKEEFFSFLNSIKDIDSYVNNFWKFVVFGYFHGYTACYCCYIFV